MCLIIIIHSSHSLLREHFEQSVFFVDMEVCTLESVFLLVTKKDNMFSIQLQHSLIGL